MRAEELEEIENLNHHNTTLREKIEASQENTMMTLTIRKVAETTKREKALIEAVNQEVAEATAAIAIKAKPQ